VASGSAAGPGAERLPGAGAYTDPGGKAAVLWAANLTARRAINVANIHVRAAAADIAADGATVHDQTGLAGGVKN